MVSLLWRSWHLEPHIPLFCKAAGCSAASLPLPPHEDQTCLQMWLWNSPGGRIRIISWEARTNPKEATLSAFCYSCHLFKTLVFNCTAHCFSLCHQPLFFSCFTIFLLVFGFRKLSYDIAMDGFLVFTVWVHRASWIHGFPFYFFVFCFSSQQIWTSLATVSSKIYPSHSVSSPPGLRSHIRCTAWYCCTGRYCSVQSLLSLSELHFR